MRICVAVRNPSVTVTELTVRGLGMGGTQHRSRVSLCGERQ